MPRKNEVDYLAEIAGNFSNATEATPSIYTGTSTTSSATVVNPNTNRTYLLIQNLSDTDMNVNFGQAASATTLRIPKDGGGVTFESSYCPTTDVRLICGIAGKAYYILEG